MWDSSAAVFWMYNDSWPATHSWTVLDYYLRRKAAFYSVKRSFAPFIIVLTEESGRVFVYAVNETKNEAAGLLRFGLFSFSGAYPFERKTEVRVPAKTSLQLASFNTREWRNRRQEAAFAFFSAQDIVVRQRLFGLPFGDLDFSKSGITADHDDEKSVYISKNFVWSVCLEEDSSSYDNCFDLYPGEEHVVRRMKNGSDPKIIGTGSDFLIEKGTNAAR
jgi:beta-mannosidase